MWRLNLSPQPLQYTFFKNGRIKFRPRPLKWSVLPLRVSMQYFEHEYCPLKYLPFDPGSRSRIVRWMRHYHDFNFPVLTDKGNPSVDPEDLASIGKEGELMVRYLKVVKSLGSLADGEGSILGNIRHDSTVKSRIDQNGTNTGRFTVSSINTAQIDAAPEFRKLFSTPSDDWVFIGCDYSGQEAVILSELLYPYDNGNLDHIINNGSQDDGTDLHSSNGKACGISRSAAKPVFFGLIYGASETLTGYTVLGSDDYTDFTAKEYEKVKTKLLKRTEEVNGVLYYPIKKGKLILYNEHLIVQTLFGKMLQTKLKANLIGFNDLEKVLTKQYKTNGYITTPGGRRLYIDSPHKCINYACQGYAAESMKVYLVVINRLLTQAGLVAGTDYVLQAIIYDEVDFIVRKEHTELVRSILLEAFPLVSRELGMSTTFTGDVIVGGLDINPKTKEPYHPSWYGCH